MRSTFKIMFYINRQKIKADGNTAILCRITIDGKSTTITTGEECNPSEWNTKQGLTTDRKTNQRLHEFREIVEKTYQDILTRDGVVSAELIKNHLQGITENPSTLLAMSRAELQALKESVGKSRAEGTYLNLSHSDKNLREFVEMDMSCNPLSSTCPSSQPRTGRPVAGMEEPISADGLPRFLAELS